MRIVRPWRSSGVLISMLNHPPICTPVLPAGNAMSPSRAFSSFQSSCPPPNINHAFCCCALNPNGTVAKNPCVGSLPV